MPAEPRVQPQTFVLILTTPPSGYEDAEPWDPDEVVEVLDSIVDATLVAVEVDEAEPDGFRHALTKAIDESNETLRRKDSHA